MRRNLTRLVLACALILSARPTLTRAEPVPGGFESHGADRAAIEALLGTYTRAVSSKDQALFESLLLSTDIPFSPTALTTSRATARNGARNYATFRKGVFEGEPFSQKFEHVRIEQDGPLAAVSLVFVNTSAHGQDWGWKALQLLKVAGTWKIASEFYTNHELGQAPP